MISKHISCKPQNDNYTRLANYIADANHAGEKSLMSWAAGCWAGDDYELGIMEVNDTQILNTRTKQEKTYHLMISFNPTDEAKLSPEVLKNIETEFAKALGFSEHQRHCGVHKNTNNLHMHVAYNMIHPEKLTRHEPFRDYLVRDKLCRDLELRYGLSIDNGRKPDLTQEQKYKRLTQVAVQVECHTGQQSFEAYAKDKNKQIISNLETATTWREVHHTLASYGMEIKPHGNGLVIKDINSKYAIKASTFDRSFSIKKLEDRFGNFQAQDKTISIAVKEQYQAVPLQRAPERGGLFAEYKAGIKQRKIILQQEKKQKDNAINAVKEKYQKEKEEIQSRNMPKRIKYKLLKNIRQHELDEIAKTKTLHEDPNFAPVREKWAKERQRIEKTNMATKLKFEMLNKTRQHEVEEIKAMREKQGFPSYTSWNEFLKQKVDLGNEVALAILRSSKDKIEPETSKNIKKTEYQNKCKTLHKEYSDYQTNIAEQKSMIIEQARIQKEAVSEKWAKERQRIEKTSMANKLKLDLLNKIRQQEVEKLKAIREKQKLPSYTSWDKFLMQKAEMGNDVALAMLRTKEKNVGSKKTKIDNKGTVIMSLPTGGSVRDTGKKIYFSAHDEAAKLAASVYAKEKWGLRVKLEGNQISGVKTQEISR